MQWPSQGSLYSFYLTAHILSRVGGQASQSVSNPFSCAGLISLAVIGRVFQPGWMGSGQSRGSNWTWTESSWWDFWFPAWPVAFKESRIQAVVWEVLGGEWGRAGVFAPHNPGLRGDYWKGFSGVWEELAALLPAVPWKWPCSLSFWVLCIFCLLNQTGQAWIHTFFGDRTWKKLIMVNWDLKAYWCARQPGCSPKPQCQTLMLGFGFAGMMDCITGLTAPSLKPQPSHLETHLPMPCWHHVGTYHSVTWYTQCGPGVLPTDTI